MIHHIMPRDVLDEGKRYFVTVYSKWSNDIMMLLPSSDDPIEKEMNELVMKCPRDTLEMFQLVNSFLTDNYNSVFMITTPFIGTELERRLARYRGEWHRFLRDAHEFDQWRKVVYDCYHDESGMMIKSASMNGWKSLIKESL